jgi:hypothetical protein
MKCPTAMSVRNGSLGYEPESRPLYGVDDFGVRCQLQPHLDGQHCALVQFDLVGARGKRRPARIRYRKFGQVWTKPEPEHASLPWAPTFPRVEA